ncbi:MAG: xylulokinase, partial [Proteobacteria bacterium]|nr:xylulokinase [Pseudomonadota bacterium]
MSAKTIPQYIGLDVGTTSLKGALIDASGTFLAIASVSYGVSRPRPGWSEQDPADYASAAIQCIRQLIASPHADPSRISALCSSGQAPTLVLLDRDRKPIRPAILWQDTRAAAEAAELSNASGSATL